jgi:hypothetical protein
MTVKVPALEVKVKFVLVLNYSSTIRLRYIGRGWRYS